jgi:hypothetical protein
MTRRIFVDLAASFAFAADASAQGADAAESRPADRPETRPAAESRPEAAPPTDPAALAYFRKAAVDQTLGDPPFTIRDLQADLRASIYEKGDDGVRRPKTAEVVEYWRAPTSDSRARYRRVLFEPLNGKETTHGFDGVVYWEKLGAEAPRELRGREDRETLRRLRTELLRLDDLASSLLLSKLDVEGATFVFQDEPKSIVVDGAETPVRTVRRRFRNEPPIDFSFSTREIDGERRVVLSGFRRRPKENGPDERLVFGVHRVVGDSGRRLVVPTVVETFEDDVLVLTGRARENDVKFNLGLEDSLFAPPRR